MCTLSLRHPNILRNCNKSLDILDFYLLAPFRRTKYQVTRIHQQHAMVAVVMNGPQRTAVFRKEFLSYSWFRYKRNLSDPCLIWCPGCRTRWERTDERTDGLTDGRTDGELAVLSFARLWTAFAKQWVFDAPSHLRVSILVQRASSTNWASTIMSNDSVRRALTN